MTEQEYMKYPVEARLSFECRIAKNLYPKQCDLLEEASMTISALRDRLAEALKSRIQ